MKVIKIYLAFMIALITLFTLFVLRDPIYTVGSEILHGLKPISLVSLILLIAGLTLGILVTLKYKIDLILLHKRDLEVKIKTQELESVARIEHIPNNPLLVRPNGDVYQIGKIPHWKINGSLDTPTLLEVQTNLLHLGYKPAKDELLLPEVESGLPSKVFLEDHIDNFSIQNLFLGVGQYETGEIIPVYKSINQLMHIGIAGSTGFGKSVFQDTLVYQILNAREDVGVILLDSGSTTFTKYRDHNKLLYPITSSETEIKKTVIEVSKEVKRRLELMEKYRGVTHIDDYNRLTGENLPYLFLAFDEFGIVLENNGTLQAKIKFLVKLARKTGCYCCFSSQTWKANEISTSIREQLITRVQFYTHSKRESNVFLDNSIGANIQKPGESYVRFKSQTGYVHLQTPIPRSLLPEVTPQISESTVSEEDQKFVGLIGEGKSRRHACLEAYNKSYAGSMVDHCKRILGEI